MLGDIRGVNKAILVALVEDCGHLCHVGIEVRRVGIAVDHGVRDSLGDLGFPAARHGGGLVTCGGVSGHPNQRPLRWIVFQLCQPDLVAVRGDVIGAIA